MNLIFSGQNILLARNKAEFCLPNDVQLEQVQYQVSPILVDNPKVTLVARLLSDNNVPADLELVNLRYVLNNFTPDQAQIIIYAQQIIHYLEQHKFCSVCGSQLVKTSGMKWLHCVNCQREVYPTISPAMIVAVRRGNELLMAQAHHYAANLWGLLAGYAEVSESLEDCVRREVFEEVGLEIDNIRYWGSQYWPFPHSLMVGFIADYVSGDIVIDHNELRHAAFYPIDDLPGLPAAKTSIAQRMIDSILNEK